MPSGRAVLLFRRLSTGDSRFKSFNVNQNTKDNHTFAVTNKNCEISDLQRSRRFLSSQQLSSPRNQGIPLTCSDHFIRMSSSDGASAQTPTCSKESHKFTNNLIQSRSPYLLQHAHNPVDWYPWGQEAFDKAKKEGKLIFLSVGYSTCHWCHVMEKESFENEAVAEIMNANFVNIKVDREERPDIDKVYMLFIQATQGHGGWPMSVFLTPDLHPVMGGTYFPPEDKWGRAGFKTILLSLAKKWKNDRSNFNETAKNIIDVLEKAAVLDKADDQAMPGNEVWKKCITMFIRRFDKEFGGFGSQPKFPQPSNLNFLFHAYARNKENAESKKCLEMCLYSLKKMANGGIHDHISSGFARYSVDNKWHVPHFEKMLYDQAQLAISYTDAYLATKDKFFADVAHDILKYVNRDLSHETGGFYSAEDADSYPTHNSKEKKEGAFCVWEYDEIESLLSDKTLTVCSGGNKHDIPYSDIFCYHFNVQKNGNTDGASDPHGELTNKNVLIILGSKEKTATKFGLTIENLDEVIKYSTDILYQERQNRPRPHLDSKMLCSWNGLMIAGFAKAGQGLGENAYIDRAIKAANFVKQYLYDEKKQLLLRSCYKGDDGQVVQTPKPIYGFLDDYAFLIKGLLELYEASLDQSWLAWARQLQVKQDELFWDQKDGAYFTSSTNDASVVLRLKEDQDGAEPCGNSVSCHNLLRLGTYAAEQQGGEERSRAENILVAFGERLAQMPAALPEMISAQMFFIDSPTQVVIAGGAEDPRTLALLSAVRSRLLPGRVLAAFDPSVTTNAPDANMAGMSDILLSRIRPGNGTPTAYVCRRYSCSLPVTDAAQLERLLDEPPPQPAQEKQASATD